MTSSRPLPRGRHKLTREQVESDQRNRLIAGVAEAVRTVGYSDTTVAMIIKNAGVSRETFYQLYDSKLDCYLDAFDFMAEALLIHLRQQVHAEGTPLERFESVLDAYLESIAAAPGFARLFLIESFAAGPQGMERRAQIQKAFADAMVELFDRADNDPQIEFACRLFIAGVSALITSPVMNEDSDGIRALRDPLLTEARARFPELR